MTAPLLKERSTRDRKWLQSISGSSFPMLSADRSILHRIFEVPSVLSDKTPVRREPYAISREARLSSARAGLYKKRSHKRINIPVCEHYHSVAEWVVQNVYWLPLRQRSLATTSPRRHYYRGMPSFHDDWPLKKGFGSNHRHSELFSERR